MLYYAILFQPNPNAPKEPKGFVFGYEAQARRALAQLRTGYPNAQGERWFLFDLKGQRWL